MTRAAGFLSTACDRSHGFKGPMNGHTASEIASKRVVSLCLLSFCFIKLSQFNSSPSLNFII